MAGAPVMVTPAPGRTMLLINARSRRGAEAESAVSAALRDHGLALERVVRVERPRQLAAAVEGLIRQGVERLIVGGGDGTLSTVAPRIADRGIVLGVVPLGTANDFARTLRIPINLNESARIAAGSHVRAIDLARANGEYFLNVASIGMSVRATVLLSARLKRWIGPAAYVVAGLRAFVRHPTFVARISSPAGTADATVHQVVVGNGRFYGGGILVAGESTLEDGTLAVYTLGTRSRWHLLRTVALQRFQVALNRPGDIYLQTPVARVETHPSGLRVNLDGELRTRTPVTFEVVPGALQVLAP